MIDFDYVRKNRFGLEHKSFQEQIKLRATANRRYSSMLGKFVSPLGRNYIGPSFEYNVHVIVSSTQAQANSMVIVVRKLVPLPPKPVSKLPKTDFRKQVPISIHRLLRPRLPPSGQQNNSIYCNCLRKTP